MTNYLQKISDVFMNPRVLKELASEIGEPLYVIFKESLRQSVIPSDWRRANVTPIFKKGSRQTIDPSV